MLTFIIQLLHWLVTAAVIKFTIAMILYAIVSCARKYFHTYVQVEAIVRIDLIEYFIGLVNDCKIENKG